MMATESRRIPISIDDPSSMTCAVRASDGRPYNLGLLTERAGQHGCERGDGAELGLGAVLWMHFRSQGGPRAAARLQSLLKNVNARHERVAAYQEAQREQAVAERQHRQRHKVWERGCWIVQVQPHVRGDDEPHAAFALLVEPCEH